MDKVLLVSVIALAVALLSMLVNLALVWKISELKSHMKWIEDGPIDSLKIQVTSTNSRINKLEIDVMDAFEKLTNHLTRHDDEIDRVVKKYAEMETRVARHTKQLEDLGNFAGITTGELRVLEQKIYKASQLPPEPEPITKQISERIEEASLKVNVKTNTIEINSLGNRVSILENQIKRNLTENDLVARVNKLECRVEEADIRKHKPDRRRKDNYYRKPNKSNVIIDEFASDIIE